MNEGHQGLDEMVPDDPGNPVQLTSSEETSWSPDSRYVVSGSADGRIVVWDVQPPRDDPIHALRQPQGPHTTWQPLKSYDGHPGRQASRCVAFNPRLGMMATAGNELAFWLPGGSSDSTSLENDTTDDMNLS